MTGQTKYFSPYAAVHSVVLILSLFNCCSIISAENVPFLLQGDDYAKQSAVAYDKAVDAYLRAKVPGVDNQEVILKLGELYYSHGDYEKCITELQSVYVSTAVNTRVAKLLGLAYYRFNDDTNALKIFESILPAYTDDEVLYCQAQVCERQNLYPQAKELYEKVCVYKLESKYKSLAIQKLENINALAKNATIEGLPEEIRKLVKSTPGTEKYPNAGAIIVFRRESVEVKPDSSTIVEQHNLIKILNDRGKGYGEIELDYDSTDEKVELVFARTIKPTGEVITVGKKHIRDVSRYMNFPLYSNARVMIVSMPEIVDGCYIEYKARWVVNGLIDDKHIIDRVMVQEYEPVIGKKFILKVPQSFAVKYKPYDPGYVKINLDFKPVVRENKDNKVYEWVFSNIPEIISEPSMPPYSQVTAYLQMSTFNSWDEIYRWWWPLAKDKIGADEAIKKQVAVLIKGKVLLKDKAEAVYHWVASKIRYVGVEYGTAGYEPHSAAEIFANKYGDCKDKAILLISMLKEAGVTAYPVLIGTRGVLVVDKQFPSLYFNHAITAVKIDDKLLYLDPTAETCSYNDLPYGDQGRYVLVMTTSNVLVEMTPVLPSENNLVKLDMDLAIDKNGKIMATRTLTTSGAYDQGQRGWLKYTKPVLVKESLKNRVNNITPGGELLDYKISDFEDLTKHVKIYTKFSGPKFLIDAGNDNIVPALGGISAGSVSRETRVYPMDLGMPNKSVSEIVLHLPEGMSAKFVPVPVTENNKWFKYINKYSLIDNITLKFEEISEDFERTVMTGEYSGYKKMYESLARETDKQVVLQRK